jgi:SEC-C motif-containing protein
VHKGERHASSPEELMRSRYSAYVLGDIDYIVATHHPDLRDEVDREASEQWSSDADWQGLEIVKTGGGGPDDDRGYVEFIAYYKLDGEDCEHHEHAEFAKIDDTWFFEDGHTVPGKPVVRDTPKVGRNAPCPCGSGKKYKKCCGGAVS